jgi:acyl-coenzyme A thioesterase PaaI-like protein
VSAPDSELRDARLAYITAFRRLQDAAVSADLDSVHMRDQTARFDALATDLEDAAAHPDRLRDGRSMGLDNVGHPFSIPLRVLESGPDFTRGTVRFHAFHHGRNRAAHGGAIALLFDELIGQLSNYPGRTMARTAYLTTNFRAVTPIETTLRVDATIDRIEGRKRFSTARLYDGDVLLADAEALFVELKPGQP